MRDGPPGRLRAGDMGGGGALKSAAIRPEGFGGSEPLLLLVLLLLLVTALLGLLGQLLDLPRQRTLLLALGILLQLLRQFADLLQELPVLLLQRLRLVALN